MELFDNKYEKHQHLFKKIDIPAKTVLIREGEVSKQIIFVKQGILRLWAVIILHAITKLKQFVTYFR